MLPPYRPPEAACLNSEIYWHHRLFLYHIAPSFLNDFQRFLSSVEALKHATIANPPSMLELTATYKELTDGHPSGPWAEPDFLCANCSITSSQYHSLRQSQENLFPKQSLRFWDLFPLQPPPVSPHFCFFPSTAVFLLHSQVYARISPAKPNRYVPHYSFSFHKGKIHSCWLPLRSRLLRFF